MIAHEIAPVAVSSENSDNSAQRWADAIAYFESNCASLRGGRTPEKCNINSIIDVSYSMDGRKLTAVKLGLCSLVANLASTDEMNITAFSSRTKPVTPGFVAGAVLKQKLPKWMEALHTDGSTACYDATISGIVKLREHQHHPNSAPNDKYIVVTLTDGVDNESVSTTHDVLRHLCAPGLDRFMFVMMAVDMEKRHERRFRSWVDLLHTKQIRVNVKTGSALVGIFKENLLCRILHTESTNPRFLQVGGEAYVPSEDGAATGACTASEIFGPLRADLLRTLPSEPASRSLRRKRSGDEEDSDSDDDDIDGGRCRSPAVSSCYSESFGSDDGDYDDFDDDNDNDDDVSTRSSLSACFV